MNGVDHHRLEVPREKLARKTHTDDWRKFHDVMGCLGICLVVSGDCGECNCTGSGGGFHFEEPAFAFVKEPQEPLVEVYELKPYELGVPAQPALCDAQLS